MSGITRKLYTILLACTAPRTHGDLSAEFIAYPTTALAALLSSKFRTGDLVRTIIGDRYAYQLSDTTRLALEKHGVEAIVRESNAPSQSKPGEPKPAGPRYRLQELATLTNQPNWPAPRRDVSLAPQIASRLPWEDEEEAPPCIGERYRDALRPRPRDD